MRSRYLIIFIVLIIVSCAKRGRPTGGPKDEDAPIMVNTKPAYKTTNFKSDEIRIYFDEYIKLKELNKQLIVSPPLKYPPIITPLGTPSKYIKIEILDTLKENTTYTFNFGQSVIDNTEGNILNNFKYIFSTGDVIDSLAVAGTIKDAFNEEADENVTIMLYEMNENYNDSLVYNEKPLYVANTLDTITWEITNIKAGKYKLIALNDASKNYKFNPKEDKIGFVSKEIDVPTDENYEITLFDEILPYKLTRPSDIVKGKIIFGYEGIADSIKINALNQDVDFKSITTFEKEKDSVNYWYKGAKADSLQFIVTNQQFQDTVTVRLRSKKVDSLQLSSNVRGTLLLRDEFKILSNFPLDSLDLSKITFQDKDTLDVTFQAEIAKSLDKINFSFEKEVNQTYKIQVLPEAIKGFYGSVNDTLNFNFRTKQIADYGNLYLKLENVKSYPIIVELLDSNTKVIETVYAKQEQEFSFTSLEPSKYKVRLIYDENENGKWDTGNFLLKLKAEKVVYYPDELDVRANWDVTETFILN